MFEFECDYELDDKWSERTATAKWMFRRIVVWGCLSLSATTNWMISGVNGTATAKWMFSRIIVRGCLSATATRFRVGSHFGFLSDQLGSHYVLDSSS